MEKMIVTQEHNGQRIDKFLAKDFFLYSRGEIIKKIKEGRILANGVAVKPSYQLEEGDILTIEDLSREREKKLFANSNIALDTVFEDEDILVLNKPYGMQVHPSVGEKENTLTNALIAKYPQIENVHDQNVDAYLRPGIVHRLDKDTSGVMVVAKNKKAFLALKDKFKNREVEKTYLAICHGTFSQKEGIIEKEIARSSDYRKQVIARSNTKTIVRPAVTKFKVLQEFDGHTLVEAKPKTGRMHQIRIHFASMGHPIVGDLIYGKKEAQKEDLRQLLHAKELKFELFGKKHDFSVPVPQDFEDFMANLKP